MRKPMISSVRTLALCFLLCSTTLHAVDNSFYFFDDNLRIKLSSELLLLSDSTLKKRYGKQKTPPTYAFSDKDQHISFTFTRFPTPANTASMRKIHKSLSVLLRQSATKANWKKDKIYNRFDTKVAVFEYETNNVGKYQYKLTYALPIQGQLTLIAFTTTNKKYKNKWLDLARQSLNTMELEAP
jgi:hypothetical protein